MTLLVETPSGREPERGYALDIVLGHFLGIPFRWRPSPSAEATSIRLEGDPVRELLMPDGLLGTSPDQWLTPAMMPPRARKEWRVAGDLPEAHVASLPVPFTSQHGRGPWWHQENGRAELRWDVLGAAFLLLTRAEEIARPERDRHGRFPSSSSVLQGMGLLRRPLVDESVQVLSAAISRLWPRLPRRRWARRVLLTHDVDRPLLALGRTALQVASGAAGDIVFRRAPGLALQRARAMFDARRGRHERDPANTFEGIMGLSERYGFRSAFYFIADSSDPETDCTYRLEHPFVRRLIRRVSERGHEIGLHPSYFTYRDPGRVQREFAALVDAVRAEGVVQERWGGRQHFLRWENPVTWQAWEDAGLAYDCTLGFADAPGFRCGTCRPYRPFNLLTRRSLRLVERPMTVMEAGALRGRPDRAVATVLDLDEQVRRFGGDTVILWHNTHLLTRAHRRVYADIVSGLAS